MPGPIPIAATTPGPQLVAAFAECWASLAELGRGLTEEQWRSPALCPGWTCKDALLHLTTAEIGFADWEDLSKPPSDRIKAAFAELRDRPGAEVLAAFERITARRREQLEAMSDAELDRPSWTAAGPGTYRRYMEIRVFDSWAHEQDIRVPLRLPGHEGGLGGLVSLNEAHLALGYLVGKRAAAPQGASVTIHVTGEIERDLHAKVDGRATVVESLDAPTAELTVDFPRFMLLCCGRIDASGPLGEGRVRLSGDLELAERVARNLAFTI
ncbi:MAG: maleylpyruvate isomerase family mycothiol-dependent enzyme [Acidimicrobiales bacterium]